MEQGRNARPRSPSPEGSASDFSDTETVVRKGPERKAQSGRITKSKTSNITEIAVKALVEMAKTQQRKGVEDDSDDSDNAQEPVMVKLDNYKVRDDGTSKLDMKLRNALRTINAKPKKYFKNFSRKVKPNPSKYN